MNEHFCIGSVSRVVVSFVFMNSFFWLEIPFFCHHDSFFWSHKVGSSGNDDDDNDHDHDEDGVLMKKMNKMKSIGEEK